MGRTEAVFAVLAKASALWFRVCGREVHASPPLLAPRFNASLGRPTSDIQRLRGERQRCSCLVLFSAKYCCAFTCIPEARNNNRSCSRLVVGRPVAGAGKCTETAPNCSRSNSLTFPSAFQSHECTAAHKPDNATQAVEFSILMTRNIYPSLASSSVSSHEYESK